MSQVSRSTFDTTYVNAAGTFADNSTRDISEGDMRQYADDISDSVVFKNDDYDYWMKVITASGTDTYTITPTYPTGYATDEKWIVKFTNSNTGAATLNRNSLGAKDLLGNAGGALSAGDIVAGGYYLLTYNGTNYRLLNVISAVSGTVSGLTANYLPKATSATTLADSLFYDSGTAIGLGTTSPDRKFHVEADLAATNTVSYLQRLTSTSTGTPAAGIGVGMEFEVETAAANNEVGGIIEFVTTDVTATSEDFDFVVKTMAAGASAAERMRVSSGYVMTINSMRLHNSGDTTNVFLGKAAGNLTMSGANNIGIGDNTLDSVTSGTSNIAIGSDSLEDVTTGSFNIGIGEDSLRNSVATNSGNIGIGYQALLTNVGQNIGDYNIAIGYNSRGAPASMSGSRNVMIGSDTGGLSLTTGSNNLFLGASTGQTTTSGSANVVIGYDIDTQSATASNQLTIQNAIFGSANSGTGTTVSSGNIGFFATTWGSSAAKVLSLGIGTEPGSAITDGIQWFAKNSSDGTANATLGLYLEQAPEATATFTQTHRLKIWVNGVEYYLSLDAV